MEEIINSPPLLYPTIFVVEEDNNARACLSKNLRQFGYRLLVVADVQDALEWVSGSGYLHADLLLIDLVGKSPEEALTIGRCLREKAQYHEQTPLVVMPESFTSDEEGTDNTQGSPDIETVGRQDEFRTPAKSLLEIPNVACSRINRFGDVVWVL